MDYPDFDPKEAQKAAAMAQTPEGKAILQKLMTEKSDQLSSAFSQGDMEKVKRLIREFMDSPEVKSLKKQMEDK